MVDSRNCDYPVSGRTVILSTDVGTDDAMAIALLSEMKKYPVDYMIASAGNTSLDNAVKNAVILKKLFGLDCRIVRGTDYEAPSNTESNQFHGADGLGGISEVLAEALALSDSDFKADLDMEGLKEQLKDHGEIIIISTGPVNAVSELIKDAEIRAAVSHIFIMGGGINEFNCSHNTEFNFYKSPKAVRDVLASGIPLTLFPLDLTNHQRLYASDIDAYERAGISPLITAILKWNNKSNEKYGNIPAAVIHDAMPVLYLSDPRRFIVKTMKIKADEYGKIYEADDGTAVRVATEADEDLLREILKKRLLQAKL